MRLYFPVFKQVRLDCYVVVHLGDSLYSRTCCVGVSAAAARAPHDVFVAAFETDEAPAFFIQAARKSLDDLPTIGASSL
jgi:hypothetical protein